MLPNKQTGSPDYGTNQSTNPTSPSFDFGEDATRLLMGGGSLARSGRWVFADGFESSTLNPYYQQGVGTPTISIFTTNSFQGVNSLSLKPSTAAGDTAQLSKYLLLPGAKYGLEMMFAIQHGSNLNCEFQLIISGGGKGVNRDKNNVGKIVLEQTTTPTNKLYWDVNGTRTLIADVANQVQIFTKYWHYIKFVFDLDQNKGVRLFFDDLVFDLSSLSGYQTTLSAPINGFSVLAKSVSAAINTEFLIDNLIISADEP